MNSQVIITGFWTFFCNPLHWDVDNYLNSIEVGTESKYLITTWQKQYFEPGQMGIIRVGHDQRTLSKLNGKPKLKRGVYAIVEIISLPKEETNFKISEQKNLYRNYVNIKYIRNYINDPIYLEQLQNDRLIKMDPYFLKGYQAASMPLMEDTFNRILFYGESGI